MYIMVTSFPVGIAAATPEVASSLYADVWDVLPGTSVFVRYPLDLTTYHLSSNGSLSDYTAPEGDIICEVIINVKTITLKTNELIGSFEGQRIHDAMRKFLECLGIKWFSMEFKKVEE